MNMRVKKIISTVAAVCMLSTGLQGCGGNDVMKVEEAGVVPEDGI